MTRRGLAILEILREKESVEVSALSETLGVSRVTVRKDLDALEAQGLLHRQHGNAVRVSSDNINYRMTFDYEVKKRIAVKAAGLVQNGEVVMIESGSTCALLAAELAESKREVTIVTNSAFIAGYIPPASGARAVLLGGMYDPNAQVMSGPLVRKCAEEYYVDKFFIGADGYEPELGFSSLDLLRAETVRTMGERAANRIVLLNAAKFGRRSVVALLPASRVSMVVCDAVPQNCREALAADGVEILEAE